MEIYIAFFFVALIGCFIKNKKINITTAIILLVCMCVMAALRDSHVGADTQMYMSSYKRIKSLQRFEFEFIFYWLSTMFVKQGLPREGMQVLVTVLTYLPLMWLFPKWSKNACLSVFVMIVAINGYFFETFNIARQAAATSYLLCAYVFLEQRRLWPALAFMVVAVGFHASSWVYVPLIILAYGFTFSPVQVYASLSVSLLFAFVLSNVGIIASVIKSATSLGFGGTEKYVIYMTYRLSMARTFFGLVTLLLPLSVLCAYAYAKLKDSVMMRIFFLGCVFLNIVSIMPTSYRMAYGMTCVELLLYPAILKSDIRYKWIPVTILVITTILWCFRLENTLKVSELVPYNIFL